MFFFNETAPTISDTHEPTLALNDALPIAGRPKTGSPRLCLGKPLEDAPNRRVARGPGERTVEMCGIHLTLMIGAVGLVVTVAEHEIPPQGRLRDERWSRTAQALAPHRQ